MNMLGDNKDVSETKDAFDFIADAVSAECHLLDSYAKTGDEKYMELSALVRKMRSEVLYDLVLPNKAENYCSAKHLAGCAKRCQEMANRELDKYDKDQNSESFDKSKKYLQYSLDFQALFHCVRLMGEDTFKKDKEAKHELNTEQF